MIFQRVPAVEALLPPHWLMRAQPSVESLRILARSTVSDSTQQIKREMANCELFTWRCAESKRRRTLDHATGTMHRSSKSIHRLRRVDFGFRNADFGFRVWYVARIDRRYLTSVKRNPKSAFRNPKLNLRNPSMVFYVQSNRSNSSCWRWYRSDA